MQVVGSIRAFYSSIPVDVVVLCEFPLSHCVCYSEDHDQLPIAKYLLYMIPSLQFNSISVSSPLMAFPGLITIVDCQRTYLVVGLPDLLLPASNLIGSEKLSA